MIDLREELPLFEPIDLSSLPDEDPRYTENVRLAFALYNKALHNIGAGYDDMARNQLKKAISLYPGFNDAIVLYGACVFANGDRIGAVRVFNSVKNPRYREHALAYLDHLAEADRNAYLPKKNVEQDGQEVSAGESCSFAAYEEGKEEEKPLPKPAAEDNAEAIREARVPVFLSSDECEEETERISGEDSGKKKSSRKVYEKRIACAVFGAVVVLLASLLFAVSHLSLQNRRLSQLLRDTEAGMLGDLTERTPNGEETDRTPVPAPSEAELREEAKTKAEQLGKYYLFKNYFSVVELFQNLDLSYLSQEERNTVQLQYESALNQFANTNYSVMYSLREEERWTDVIHVLLPIWEYYPEYEKMPMILYYLAQAYEKTGDTSRAIQYYGYAAEKYGDTTYGGYAKSRLTVLRG